MLDILCVGGGNIHAHFKSLIKSQPHIRKFIMDSNFESVEQVLIAAGHDPFEKPYEDFSPAALGEKLMARIHKARRKSTAERICNWVRSKKNQAN